MNEQLEGKPKTCSCCGNQGSYDSRYFAIAARTYYQGRKQKRYATGEVAIWDLPICSICMPKTLLSYADGKIRSARSGALAGAFIFLIGIASIVFSNLTHHHYYLFEHHHDLAEGVITGPASGLDMIFLIAMGFALIVGPIIAIGGAALAISRRRQRRQMTESNVVPADLVGKCFETEADRILALLIKAKKKGQVTGGGSPMPIENFPLPAFKELTELSDEEREIDPPVKFGKVSKIWVRLKIVSESYEDITAKIPSKWKRSATASVELAGG